MKVVGKVPVNNSISIARHSHLSQSHLLALHTIPTVPKVKLHSRYQDASPGSSNPVIRLDHSGARIRNSSPSRDYHPKLQHITNSSPHRLRLRSLQRLRSSLANSRQQQQQHLNLRVSNSLCNRLLVYRIIQHRQWFSDSLCHRADFFVCDRNSNLDKLFISSDHSLKQCFYRPGHWYRHLYECAHHGCCAAHERREFEHAYGFDVSD